MELTGNTIKTGLSVVGDFRLEYSVTNDADNMLVKLDAQIKRVSGGTTRYVGNIMYVETSKRYSVSLSEGTTSEERLALITDFENTIAELSK